MAVLSSIIGSAVSALIGGITSYQQSKATSKEARAQAQQLKNNMKELQAELRRGEIDLTESLQRIDTMIGNTKGQLKAVMENQVDLAVKDIKDQYKSALTSAMRDIKSELGARRLLGSEVGIAARRRTTKEIETGAEKNIASLRERALNNITAQLAQLDLKGGLLKEQQRAGFRDFRLGALSEIMQLGNLSGTLSRQSETNPWLAALSGAAPGLGGIATTALAPGISATEEQKDIDPFTPDKAADTLADTILSQDDINV